MNMSVFMKVFTFLGGGGGANVYIFFGGGTKSWSSIKCFSAAGKFLTNANLWKYKTLF